MDGKMKGEKTRKDTSAREVFYKMSRICPISICALQLLLPSFSVYADETIGDEGSFISDISDATSDQTKTQLSDEGALPEQEQTQDKDRSDAEGVFEKTTEATSQLPSSKEPYWISEPVYETLLAEYDAAKPDALDKDIIFDAQLAIKVPSEDHYLDRQVSIKVEAKELKGYGTNEPAYDDEQMTLLTLQESIPASEITSDSAMLKLIKSCKEVFVYEAIFFFGSRSYPTFAFVALKTYVLLAPISEEESTALTKDDESAVLDILKIPTFLKRTEEMPSIDTTDDTSEISSSALMSFATYPDIVPPDPLTYQDIPSFKFTDTIRYGGQENRLSDYTYLGDIAHGFQIISDEASGTYGFYINGALSDADKGKLALCYKGGTYVSPQGLPVKIDTIVTIVDWKVYRDVKSSYLGWTGFKAGSASGKFNDRIDFSSNQIYGVSYTVRFVPADSTDPVIVKMSGALGGFQLLGGDDGVIARESIKLYKASLRPSFTTNNAHYSLQGAHYGIYNSFDDANFATNAIATLITDETGYARIEGLYVNTYDIKETVAPKGYVFDKTVYEVTVEEGIAVCLNVYDEPFFVRARIFKMSANPEVTDALDTYRLDDAVFEICDSTGEVIATLTTDGKSGVTGGVRYAGTPYTSYILIPSDTYYYREVKAPTGFQEPFDNSPVRFVASATDMTFIAYDEPAVDPVSMLIQKLGAMTGEAYNLAGRSSLAGAEFSVRYWDGYYSTIEEAKAFGAATRTWVFTTSNAGQAYFHNSYLKDGSDPLYISEGRTLILLGAIIIAETKAPDGYLIPDYVKPVLQQVRFNEDTQQVTVLNAPEIPNYPSWNLTIKKVNGATGKPLSGAAFELWRKDTSLDTLLAKATLDEKGNVTFPDNIIDAFGTYTIKEVAWPEGYQDPKDAGIPHEDSFTISKELNFDVVLKGLVTDTDNPHLTCSYDEATEKLWVLLNEENFAKRAIEIIKTDKDTHAPVAHTTFEVLYYPVSITEGTIVSDISVIGTSDLAWRQFVPVKTITTDAQGKASFTDLTYGYYQFKETKPNENCASYEKTQAEIGKLASRFVKIDRATTGEVELFEDMAIEAGREVYKKTIATTASALDATKEGLGSSVGDEEYIYRFGALSKSNVGVDEFIIVDDLSYVTQLGYRMTTLWSMTSLASLDWDGYVALLYKTNLTKADKTVQFSYDPLFVNPYNPNNPKRKMYYSNEAGRRIWKEKLSTTKPSRLKAADLPLAKGEYLIGLKCVYGGVDKGFYTGRGWQISDEEHVTSSNAGIHTFATGALPVLYDWRYAVSASFAPRTTDERGNEAAMYASTTACLARNLTQEGLPVLSARVKDSVKTRVVDSFSIPTLSLGLSAGKDSLVAHDTERLGLLRALSGDAPLQNMIILMFVARIGALVSSFVLRQKTKTKEQHKRYKDKHLHNLFSDTKKDTSSFTRCLKGTLASLLLASVLSTALLFKDAYAEEISGEPVIQKDGTATLTFSYSTKDGVPNVLSTLVIDGKDYELLDVSEALRDETYVPATKEVSTQITKEIPLEGKDDLDRYFDAVIPFSVKDYTGNIGLDAQMPYTIENIYETWSGQIDGIYVFEGLFDNDLDALPQQMSFETRSDSEPGAKTQQILSLAKCVFEVSAYDELGFPESYKATCIYRGKEYWLELRHYLISAHYSGTLHSSFEQLTFKATYVALPSAQTTPIVDETVPLTSPNSPVSALAVLALTAVVLMVPFLLLCLMLLRKNARLMQTMRPHWADEVKGKTLCVRHLHIKGGKAFFVIPDKISIYDPLYNMTIVLKGHIAYERGELVVVWRRRVIYQSPLQKSVRIPVLEMLYAGEAHALIEERAFEV
jgi:hypothetical protein